MAKAPCRDSGSVLVMLVAAVAGCATTNRPAEGPAQAPPATAATDSRPPPMARVEALPPLGADAACEGQLVIEVDRLLIREYPRAALTPPFRFLPIVVGVLSLPGGPDEGDVTVLAASQVYRAGDRVRLLEGRAILDRPVRRLGGLRFELHLAENHTTVTPDWMSYAMMASQAAKALPGPTSDVIGFGAQVIRKLDHDDVMLTWTPRLDELVAYARRTGPIRYRLATPSVLADGSPAAELDVLVHIDREASCPP